jgi:hypothetical protein
MQGLRQVVEGVLIIVVASFPAKRVPMLDDGLRLYVVFEETWHRLKVLGDSLSLVERFLHCVVDKGLRKGPKLLPRLERGGERGKCPKAIAFESSACTTLVRERSVSSWG